MAVCRRTPYSVSCPRSGTSRSADASWVVVADLRGGDDVTLLVDLTLPLHHLPVVPPGVEHEGGRYREHLRAAVYRQMPVQLGEAQVVADRQADRDAVDGDRRGFFA